MQRALKCKSRYIFLSALAFVFAVIMFVLAILMLQDAKYLQLSVCSVASAIFCYATVFFAFSAYDFSVIAIIAPLVAELGEDNVGAIAQRIGWKRTAVSKFIKKLKKHGYI